MKNCKVISIFALTLLLMGGIIRTAFAAQYRDLTVYNNTGYTIYRLYIYPSDIAGIGCFDRLETNVLKSGESITIKYNAEYKYYDLKIVLEDESEHTWRGNNALNFAGSTMLVFTYLGNGRFNARAD